MARDSDNLGSLAMWFVRKLTEEASRVIWLSIFSHSGSSKLWSFFMIQGRHTALSILRNGKSCFSFFSRFKTFAQVRYRYIKNQSKVREKSISTVSYYLVWRINKTRWHLCCVNSRESLYTGNFSKTGFHKYWWFTDYGWPFKNLWSQHDCFFENVFHQNKSIPHNTNK